MKSFIFVSGLAVSFLIAPAFAQDSVPKKVETPKVVEKIDPIKRADFFRQQYAMFSKADKNFDSQVTNDEILGLTHETKKPKYVAAFKAIDTDNNGFISLEEVAIKHEEITENLIKRHSRNRDNVLRLYDQDGNGTITPRELDEYFELKAKEQRDKTAKNAANDLKAKDADNSGSVSLDEYLDSKTFQTARSLLRQPESARRSATRDPNGDKIIKRSENEAFVTEFFAALDKNKDDELSAAEQSNKLFRYVDTLSIRRIYLPKDTADTGP